MVRTYTTVSGTTVLVGETAGENQQLCKNARQNDEWFHVDGAPSAHAILQNGGKAVSRDDVHDCAQLVKHFSKLRNAQRVFVNHIPAKFVSKNGVEDQLGAVTLKKKASRVPVVADEATLERLFGTGSGTGGSSSRKRGK